jgi:hypothetical protein
MNKVESTNFEEDIREYILIHINTHITLYKH